MTKIISIHSARRGTGKSSIVKNIAIALAYSNTKVGIIDLDFLAPGIHYLFGVNDNSIQYTINDFLTDQCSIDETLLDVTQTIIPSNLDKGKYPQGKIYLAPSNINFSDKYYGYQPGYDHKKLSTGIEKISTGLDLDFLILDTCSSYNNTALLAFALCDMLILIMRLDKQDYRDTYILLKIARKLSVPYTSLIVNEVLSWQNDKMIKKQIQKQFECPVSALIPHSSELMTENGNPTFFIQQPHNHINKIFNKLTKELLAVSHSL